MARTRRSSGRPYRRTDRVNELVREIVADQLLLIDDERLELVTVTGVEVDPELRTGVVFVAGAETAGGVAEADAAILAALGEHRVRLQRAIGDQARMRRTPELSFRMDEGVRAGQRIEEILRDIDSETGQEDERDGDEQA